MNETIVIVDATSTGVNYILDVYKRGYHPVVIEPLLSEDADENLFEGRRLARKKYGEIASFYNEQDTYEKTLELVKAFKPKLVLPGGEFGVILATRLADDLGLPGNPYERISNFVNKQCMQKALKEAGLRYIRGKLVSNVEEAVSFYREEELTGCVVKPCRGAASVGVHLCDNEEELIEALKNEMNSINVFGESSDSILIQERIRGDEFIVNTVSYGGVHRLSSIYSYKKKKVEGGGNVYDYAMFEDKLKPGYNRLVRYALDVAAALGYEYGAIHGEYMMDEKGPVLIEVNTRVMGCNMDPAFCDSLYRHHETDNVLDSYLKPSWHMEQAKLPYQPVGYGAIKLFIVKEDTDFETAPVLSIIRRLRSFHRASLGQVLSGHLMRTIDLETNGGVVYLAHKDKQVLQHDLEFLEQLEQRYEQMLFGQYKRDKVFPEKLDTIQEVMELLNCDRSVFVLSNDENLQIPGTVCRPGETSKAERNYDWGILDLNYREDEDIETMIEDFYDVVSRVRKGGYVVIPKRTYWHFPCERESIEILCECLDLTMEAPRMDWRDVIIVHM